MLKVLDDTIDFWLTSKKETYFCWKLNTMITTDQSKDLIERLGALRRYL
ncbi:hypothetical protein [Ulvibacterium sp.]